jgi:hypothetical protein
MEGVEDDQTLTILTSIRRDIYILYFIQCETPINSHCYVWTAFAAKIQFCLSVFLFLFFSFGWWY